jgi:hypothetical protein
MILFLGGARRVEESIMRDYVFHRSDEERRPVCGFGVVVRVETLVTPVWEKRAGLDGGSVSWGSEQWGNERLVGGEFFVGGWEGKDVG